MNTSFRPVNTPVPSAQLVSATPASAPDRTQPTGQAAHIPDQPARPRPAAHPEADDQSTRDFYAWCAGCEGYGSIF